MPVLPTEPVTPITLALRTRARGAGEVAQAFEHVRHDQQRRIFGNRARWSAATTASAGAGCKRRRHEFMAVAGSPLIAKNASPRPMVRLSIEMPATDAGNAPLRSARIACAIASTVQSGSLLMPAFPRARQRPRRGR